MEYFQCDRFYSEKVCTVRKPFVFTLLFVLSYKSFFMESINFHIALRADTKNVEMYNVIYWRKREDL